MLIKKNQKMRITYILFDGITWLDFIGAYHPISQLQKLGFLPDLTWQTAAMTPTIVDDFGLKMTVDAVMSDLSEVDLIIVPGGWGTRPLRYDDAFLNWLKTAEKVPIKCAVCTGALLLGAAGFLKNKRITTNYQAIDLARPYCREVVDERIVEDDGIITAGAVASSIDLGLYICKKLAGFDVAETIRLKMDYGERIK
jgi:transcriptional regulator GlxA family with amidase domain